MKLYNYWRSSASYRVRIALALKGLSYEYVAVHLVKNEQLGDAFRALSPGPARARARARRRRRRAPDPVARDHRVPRGNASRAAAPADGPARPRPRRAIALDIACEIHPLDNLRVLRYLVKDMGLSEDAKDRWYRHWVETGLETVERQLAGHPATGRFCHGDTPGLADCVLVPQIHNAERMKCRLDHVPTVMRVFANCMAEAAFATTQASACPDAA
jgi:maleylacetoacetate isomerase/maleylpyruvate isomerase